MQRKKILNNVINGSQIVNGVHPSQPLLELYGAHRLLIEHHKGICEYSDCTIRVRLHGGNICICGDQLQISYITKERMIITGNIDGIQFHWEAWHEKNCQ